MLALFLCALGVGILWALWLLPRGEVHPGYAAWMATTAFAVPAAGLALGWAGSRRVDPALALAASGALAYRSALALGGRRAATGLALASLLGGAGLARAAWALSPGGFPLATAALSALVLGVTLDAMVLGHWHLVQHGLSFGPLRRMSLALMLVLGARLGVSALWLGTSGDWRRFASGDALLFGLLRGLLGLLGPLGLGAMVLACVRIKSNTSATGILYVITLFVLLGEFTAAYFLERGVYL